MAGETAVLSTHGDIAAEVLDALTPGLSAKARYKLRLLKGEVWVVQSTGDIARDRRPPPPGPPAVNRAVAARPAFRPDAGRRPLR